MEDYQLRIVEELRELNIKIDKLNKFTRNDNTAFMELLKEERYLLFEQLGVMLPYKSVLNLRIISFS